MNEQELKFDEEWSRWEPNLEILGRYSIQKISYNYDDFRLILKSCTQSQFIEIIFEQTIGAIRIANESVVFRLYDDLCVKYGKDFYLEWSFFKVQNSDCLKWLSKGTYGTSELYDLTHYAISDLDMVIDVVTRHIPIVKIIDNYHE